VEIFMVRFALSSAGWLCTIGLLTTAIPVFALPEGPITQSTLPAPANVEQLMAIGKAQAQKGDFEGAIGTYRQALSIAEAAHNLPQQMSVLIKIGLAYSAEASDVEDNKHDYPLAIKLYEQQLEPYQQALTIARKIGDRESEALLLGQIGGSYTKQQLTAVFAGQEPAKRLLISQKALPFLQQALEIAKELKDNKFAKLILAEFSLTHNAIADIYTELKQYDNALEQVGLMYIVAKELGDSTIQRQAGKTESLIYANMKELYDKPEQYDKYIEVIQKQITIDKRLNEPEPHILQLEALIASVYKFRGQYAEALAAYQKILTRAEMIHDYQSQFHALSSIGSIYNIQAKYSEALTVEGKALQLNQIQLKSPINENTVLNNRGAIYLNQGKYDQALVDEQQSLAIVQKYYEHYAKGMTSENIREYCLDLSPSSKIHSADICEHPDKPILGFNFNSAKKAIEEWAGVGRDGMQKEFNNIARIYSAQGDYRKASENNKISLAIARELKEPSQEAVSLINMGADYITLGQFEKANEFLKEALKIVNIQGNRPLEVATRRQLGIIAREQGDYATALKEYQQALTLSQAMKMRSREAIILSQIGDVYQSQGNYATALENYKKALDIQEAIGEPANKIETLLKRGNLERQLGQPKEALATHRDALAIAQKIGAKQLEAKAILAIATDHREQGQLDNALKGYNQALEIATSIDDLNAKPQALYGIGQLYAQQNQPDKALTYLNQALAIQQRTGVKPRQAETLSAIGQVQTQLGKYAEAQTTLQRAYVLAQTVGDRATEATALANLGQLADRQKQPEIAILFYKQSVNTYESIRQNLLSLAQDQQKSYAETVADTYRTLAQLLIEQSRIGEAQQVLELLKIQELKDFDPVVRAKVDRNGKTIELDNSEKKIVSEQDTYIAFAQKLQECEDKNEGCKELKDKRVAAKADYDKVVQSFEQEIKDRKIKDEKNFLDPKNPLNAKAQEIIQAQPNTALIYTLVTEKRLWIVLATQSEVLRSFEVNVTQAELSKTVAEFQNLTNRCELRNCTAADTAAFKVVSQQLHTWLFPKDLQTELQGTKTTPKIEHLVFALDRVTRYIPMSALFDGQKYLIQDYTVTTIVSADSTRSERLPDTSNTKVLAFGFSNALPPDFLKPLTAVVGELNSILRDETDATDKTLRFPGRKFLNEQFTTANLEQYLPKRQILHIATHGEFVGGSQEQSYIVLGDGRKLKISEMLKLYGLPGVNLVVLSACQTALASKDSTGVEISSVGNAFFEKGVKSVVASLWNVNDGSTSLLMQEFYKHLAEGKTKTAALREAQLDLMTGQKTEKDVPRGNDADVKLTQKPGTTRAPTNQPTDYRHPYYWAPFILIGNGL
jgi:CHAT domain-containing protein/Tfp pilus assembly protein PilF